MAHWVEQRPRRPLDLPLSLYQQRLLEWCLGLLEQRQASVTAKAMAMAREFQLMIEAASSRLGGESP